jgi:hypothetical protein
MFKMRIFLLIIMAALKVVWSSDVVCTADLCWDGSSRDPLDCSCPEDSVVCTADLCWDG